MEKTAQAESIGVSEQERVEGLGRWYLDEQLDFDKKLVEFKYRTLKPYFQGPEALELGPGDGQMTRLLVHDFSRLTVVEGSATLLASIAAHANLLKVQALFEEFTPSQKFNTIIMAHILEHIDDPVGLLRRAGDWLAAGGKILAAVPNANSFHRLAAVKMGLLARPDELNARDHAVGHRRVYDPASFRRDFAAAGLRVLAAGGVFCKPLSNQQIEDHWTPAMIEGFYQLGKDFPDYGADIYLVGATA